MTLRYLFFRLLTLFFVVWVAASINFLLPRLVPGDPIQGMLDRLEQQGQQIQNREEIIEGLRERFGLNDSLGVQYVRYLGAMLRLDFGYSITFFPATVRDIVWASLPWTLGLLTLTTLFSFAIGILLGALFMWRGSGGVLRVLSWFLIAMSPMPYYLVAILLLFLFGFVLSWFPVSSAAMLNRVSGFNWESFRQVVSFSALPALSILLASVGGWALSMRAMMITVQGEDYITLARAKGLKERRILTQYAVRNALLPQMTQLGISLSTVVSGGTLVEAIFLYPGLGFTLYQAIGNLDYPMVQGITFLLVLSVAVGVFLIDLIYPRLDPRISYERR